MIFLTSLLSLGILFNSVGSSAPSPVPAPAGGDNMVAADPTPSILTFYNDNATHLIDETSSFNPGTIVVTDHTTLRMEANGYVEAPKNGYKSDTEWPAIRLSIGSILYAAGGSVTGALATIDSTDGGEAIEIYNGQSGPETASRAYFYDGRFQGGDSSKNGVGGTALHVHGFGTSVFIHGGSFKGGRGSNAEDGLSIYTSNGGNVHLYSGSFEGGMEVGDSSVIAFYGCFRRNGTKVTGVFADETELEVNVRSRNGGEVVFIHVADQECEAAPSTAPSPYPTLSSQPTAPQPNGGSRIGVSYGFTFFAAFTLVQ